jgi:hypothetical protein
MCVLKVPTLCLHALGYNFLWFSSDPLGKLHGEVRTIERGHFRSRPVKLFTLAQPLDVE